MITPKVQARKSGCPDASCHPLALGLFQKEDAMHQAIVSPFKQVDVGTPQGQGLSVVSLTGHAFTGHAPETLSGSAGCAHAAASRRMTKAAEINGVQ